MRARDHYILDLGMETLRESYRRGDLVPQKLVESIIFRGRCLGTLQYFYRTAVPLLDSTFYRLP